MRGFLVNGLGTKDRPLAADNGGFRKKNSLAIVVGVLSALGANYSLAQSSLTIYGGIDIAIRYVKFPAGSVTSLSSGGNYTSRFGFSGTEDLGGGLRAGFRLESTLAADTGTVSTGNQFFDRVSYVSLSGPWGEFRFGRDFTPAFKSFSPADPFGFVGLGGLTNAFSTNSTFPIFEAFGAGANTNGRSSNSVGYTTGASESGLFANIMVAPSEGGQAGAYRYYGGRVGLKREKFDVTIYGSVTRIPVSQRDFQQLGVAGRYSFDYVKLTFNVTQLKYMNSVQLLSLVGIVIPVGPGEIKASYTQVTNQGAVGSRGISRDGSRTDFFALGYVHHLSKRTALYSTVARIANTGLGSYGLPGVPPAAGKGSRGIEAGIRHIF